MELLADTPRTIPSPNKETFPVGYSGTKCYRCRKNLEVGTTGGWLIKPVRDVADIDPKDDKVHYDCWWDRVWYYEHGMANAEDRNPPSGDPGINLGEYDRPVTKQMIDEGYAEQPSNRELVMKIGDAIESLQNVRKELHDVYKQLHRPYYGQG